MKSLHKIFTAALAAGVFVLGSSSAGAESGPAEKAGKAIDHAAGKVAKGVSKAAEKTGEALGKAGEKIQQVAKKAQKE